MWSEDFKQLGSIKFVKKVNNVTCCQGRVMVADRFGDIHIYKINDIISEGDRAKTVGIMALQCTVTSVAMTADSKFVITGDKDEKICVTKFPETHAIEMFCLGHKEFVSALAPISDKLLVSGSADSTLRLWDFMSGKQLFKMELPGKQMVTQLCVLDAQHVLVLLEDENELLVVRVENGTSLVEADRIKLPSAPAAVAPYARGFLALSRSGSVMPFVPLKCLEGANISKIQEAQEGKTNAASIDVDEESEHKGVYFWKYRRGDGHRGDMSD